MSVNLISEHVIRPSPCSPLICITSGLQHRVVEELAAMHLPCLSISLAELNICRNMKLRGKL